MFRVSWRSADGRGSATYGGYVDDRGAAARAREMRERFSSHSENWFSDGPLNWQNTQGDAIWIEEY